MQNFPCDQAKESYYKGNKTFPCDGRNHRESSVNKELLLCNSGTFLFFLS